MNQNVELLPCPFCGAGKIDIQENGRRWSGTGWGEPASVSIRHWCEPIDGSSSGMVECVGRDRAAAVAAWNRRAVLQSPDREDAERLDWIEANHGCDITEFADGRWEVNVPDGPYAVGKDMREAIDRARRIEN